MVGYRSDVAISIYKKDFDELCDRIRNKAIEEDTRIELMRLLRSASIYVADKNNESIVTLIFDSVKWYEGFEEIDYLMDFIRKRRYSFRRIGESLDDVDEEDDESYGLSDIVYVMRCFDLPYRGRRVESDEAAELLGLNGPSSHGSKTIEDLF